MSNKQVPFISLIACLVLGVIFVVSGCSSSGGQKTSAKGQKTDAGQAKKPMQLTILGGAPGGDWASIAEGLGEIVRRENPAAEVTVQPGKSGPNAVMVATGEADFAVEQSHAVVLALKGKGEFKNPLNIRAVALIGNKAAYQLIIKKEIGITSLEEIKEKKYPLRIAVNKKGSAMDEANKLVLNSYGITYEDIEKWGGKVHFLSFQESFNLMDNGQLDALGGLPDYPASYFIQAGTKHKLLLLPLSEKAITTANELFNTWKGVIPAGTYSYNDSDVLSFIGGVVLITGEKEPAEKVYEVAKAINNRFDYFKSIQASLRELTLKDLTNPKGIPMHKGAEQYFKDAGLIK